MSTLAASLLVIGILVCVGGPLLWWVLFRMDEGPLVPAGPPLPTGPLSAGEIADIGSSLGLTLPEPYREYLAKERKDDIDGETVLGDADLIVSWTKDYRAGFAGLAPWPHHWIYIGDAGDACPFVLDAETGEVLQIDKGNKNRKPLARFMTFRDFIAAYA